MTKAEVIEAARRCGLEYFLDDEGRLRPIERLPGLKGDAYAITNDGLRIYRSDGVEGVLQLRKGHRDE